MLSPVPLYKQHAMKSPSQLNLSSPVSYLFPSCCLGNTYSSFKIQLKRYLLCGAHLKPLKATWIILPPSSPSGVHSVLYNPLLLSSSSLYISISPTGGDSSRAKTALFTLVSQFLILILPQSHVVAQWGYYSPECEWLAQGYPASLEQNWD